MRRGLGTIGAAPAVALAGGITVATLAGVASAAEADLIADGRDLYGDMCAACHGREMVNAGGIAFDLRKFPREDFARFRNSVLNGKNQAMPAWRDSLSDEDVAALWAYVRSGG
jgi:mono/diheme cytochrome c family protein